MAMDDIIPFLQGLIRQYALGSDSSVEHTRFFQSGFSMPEDEAKTVALRYIGACYYLNNAPGFAAQGIRGIPPSHNFDAEFAKAGLGTVVRGPTGEASAKLRIANHLEGKANAREALRNMAPSRRSALLMEIQRIKAMPDSAWHFQNNMVTFGVRG